MSGDEQRDGRRIVRFGVFEADLAAGELHREGALVKLQDQPFRLLALLLERPGTVVTREELRAALWPDGSFVDFEYGVNTAIKKLRYALGDSADNPRFVQTLPRKGYRFIAPVNPEGPLQPTADTPSAAASPKRHGTWMFAAALAALLASGFWWFRLRPAPGPLNFPVPLTAYPGSEWSPAFSPDGRQVAFSWNGEHEDNYDMYVKTNGSESPTRLTTDPAPDFSPAWSPDGRRIAFLRELGEGRRAIMMVPASGGPEVKIGESASMRYPLMRNLAFSRDGHWLVTTALDPEQKGPRGGLFLFQVENGERRRLTLPPVGYPADSNPAFSPDGRSLAFCRGMQFYGAQDLYILPLGPDLSPAGEPRRITFWNRFTQTPAWTADGGEIIAASGNVASTHLWRIPVFGRREPTVIAAAGDGATLPALAPDGRLAFTRSYRNISILTLDLAASGQAPPPLLRWSASSSRIDQNPRFSPDGRRVVFVSTRTGTFQVWIANADGTGAFQLTSVTMPWVGSPSWSPDGSTILFDALNNGRFEIYAVSAAGGTPRRVMASSGHDAVAKYSRDGRWIYFTSSRKGDFQIWRMPAGGGEAVQWTHHGGRVAVESFDGRYLYFAKMPVNGSPSLWRMPAAGGEEIQILGYVVPFSFDVSRDGLYYLDHAGPDGSYPLQFYSFSTQKSTTPAAFSNSDDDGLAVSPDGRKLLLGKSTPIGADLMVIENFR